MELIQVNWDENEDLFLKFQKDPEEADKIQPENIKNISVHYKLYRKYSNIHETPPFLFSTRKSFFNDKYMGVAIELEEIHNVEDVMIDLLSLSIKFNSGNNWHIRLVLRVFT